jgi:hypothetical protein
MPRLTQDRGDAIAGLPVKAIDQTLPLQNLVQAQEQTSDHKKPAFAGFFHYAN